MNIHPSAIISPEAQIGDDVVIGPYTVIKGKVKIGSGSRIENNVTIGHEAGVVEMGRNNVILPGAVVGGPPQDLSYKGETTKLIVGDNNIIREYVTLNLGTTKGGGVTKIGNENMLMAYTHIAHDCQLGDRVVIANATHFAGHVIVEDDVKIGGGCLVSQFCKLGRFSYIAGDATINKDILPYSIAQGNYAVVRANNRIGMERAGFSKNEIESVHRAIRFLIMGDRTIEEALAKIQEECEPTESVKHLVHFVKTSERGLAR